MLLSSSYSGCDNPVKWGKDLWISKIKSDLEQSLRINSFNYYDIFLTSIPDELTKFDSCQTIPDELTKSDSCQKDLLT